MSGAQGSSNFITQLLRNEMHNRGRVPAELSKVLACSPRHEWMKRIVAFVEENDSTPNVVSDILADNFAQCTRHNEVAEVVDLFRRARFVTGDPSIPPPTDDLVVYRASESHERYIRRVSWTVSEKVAREKFLGPALHRDPSAAIHRATIPAAHVLCMIYRRHEDVSFQEREVIVDPDQLLGLECLLDRSVPRGNKTIRRRV